MSRHLVPSDEEVAAIRDAFADGVSYSRLCRAYHLNYYTIRAYCKRRSRVSARGACAARARRLDPASLAWARLEIAAGEMSFVAIARELGVTTQALWLRRKQWEREATT